MEHDNPSQSGPRVDRPGRSKPLFVELQDPIVDSALVFTKLVPFTTRCIRTKAGSLLAYTKSEHARRTLLESSFTDFRCRPTQRSQEENFTPANPRKPKESNLFVVIRGIDRKYRDEDLKKMTGLPSTRMFSAELQEYTGSVRARCPSLEKKKELLSKGFYFDFRRHRVDDYTPREIFKAPQSTNN